MEVESKLHSQTVEPSSVQTEAFWRQFLKGFTFATPIEIEQISTHPDRELQPAPPEHSSQALNLSPASTSALSAFAQDCQVSVNILLQAAWAVLLSRASGEADVLFGVQGVDSGAAIAPESPLVPVRTQVVPEAELHSWLQQLQTQWDTQQSHCSLPLTQIYELSEVLDGTPLFESLLSVRAAGAASNWSTCPLSITATLAAELELQVHYDRHRFSAAAMTRLLGHLQTLLEGMVANPAQRLVDLPLTTAAERQQLLVEWNNTQTPYPHDYCIQQLVERQVALTPDTIAVQFGDQTLTYRELDQRANQLAHQLQAIGVQPDELVGICVERSLEMIVGLLGIFKAGGAYLPLDPAYPPDRLSFMIQDARMPVLLTQQPLVERLPAHNAQVICLDTQWETIAALPETNPGSAATPINLAYVIYTSGSTGQPKGVMLNHRLLVNLIAWQIGTSTPQPGARTLQFSPISFDVSFQEIFSTLSSGGTLVLIEDSVRRDAVALWRFLIQDKIERLFLPFVALQHLAEVAEHQTALPTQLRDVITAGEQLQITRQVAGLFSKLTDCSLHNHYGPSESHVVTALTLKGSPQSWAALPAIGTPIANTQMLILDPCLQPVPIGFVGELYIGVDDPGRGYLHRPDLTSEKFIPHPLNADPTARIYKTGDLARYRPDGNIEFLGRIDHQVKIRGFRIELGELESQLSRHPAVREAIVVAREDVPGDKRLVAYVVQTSAQPLTTTALRNFLKQTLPDYMVPATFVFLEKLPLTPSGKVDRRSLLLQPLTLTRPNLEESYIAPRTPLERQLTNIWLQVLRLDRVGVHDNFFELGGTSLLGVQMIEQVQQQMGVEIRAVKLYQYPTVGTLAHYLAQLAQHQTQPDPQPAVNNLQARAQRQKAAQVQRQRPAKRG